jgi:hypothetical protein
MPAMKTQWPAYVLAALVLFGGAAYLVRLNGTMPRRLTPPEKQAAAFETELAARDRQAAEAAAAAETQLQQLREELKRARDDAAARAAAAQAGETELASLRKQAEEQLQERAATESRQVALQARLAELGGMLRQKEEMAASLHGELGAARNALQEQAQQITEQATLIEELKAAAAPPPAPPEPAAAPAPPPPPPTAKPVKPARLRKPAPPADEADDLPMRF